MWPAKLIAIATSALESPPRYFASSPLKCSSKNHGPTFKSLTQRLIAWRMSLTTYAVWIIPLSGWPKFTRPMNPPPWQTHFRARGNCEMHAADRSFCRRKGQQNIARHSPAKRGVTRGHIEDAIGHSGPGTTHRATFRRDAIHGVERTSRIELPNHLTVRRR